MRLLGRMALAGVLATALFAAAAGPAGAIHQGATIDCGSAGTYTLKTGTTSAGLFPPGFFQVDLLSRDGKVVGTLIPFAVSINGEPVPLVSIGATDALAGSVGLSTCSFTAANGDYVELTGLLNLR